MLQHCLKELKAELWNKDSWKTEEDMRSKIAILLLIWDMNFNKTDRKMSIMANVEADADLYLGTQRPDQSTDEFYKTFTPQVDTINAHRGRSGFHNGVYNKNMLALWDRDLVNTDLLAAMIPTEKTTLENRLQKEAMESSCKEYLVCLFILLVEGERFNAVMAELSNN